MVNVAVIRIAGRAKNKERVVETLDRLKLRKKFSCRIIESSDNVRKGMVHSVKDLVSYGEISDELISEIKKKRKEVDGVFFLHPPRGGFKKSSKVAAPKGILGHNKDITKLIERML